MTVDKDKLVRMAEQITANLDYTDDTDRVVAKIADHLGRFWDPRMKSALQEYANEHPEALSPLLRDAVVRL